MTPDQIQLVQASFQKVVPISDKAAELFYGRLFEIAPGIRSLFKSDIEEQGRKLMTTLGVVVNGLSDFDAVLPAAKTLAVRHVEYGVEPSHYPPVGAALIWTLEQGLGDAFDDATRTAWSAAYAALSNVMIEAAYSNAEAAE
ncbi:MAG: globin family protein [Roseibium sp.]|uniref:globin family protein n=1 Tax=Roseibium sp. TaxID=1936156 RepID=UPI003D9C3C88